MAILAALGGVLVAGCGGGSSTATTATVPNSPATSTQGSTSSVDAVALVSARPISRASYAHWLAVEKALGAGANPSHEALAFLITSEWVLGEAAARKISVSEAEVKRRFARIEQQSFPKAGAFAKFLAKSGETEADLLARVRLELLQARIVAQVSAGKSGSRGKAALAGFERTFQRHWRGYTTCKPGYVMEDCSEYRGAPEKLTATGSPSRGSASSPSTTSGAARRSSPATTASGAGLPAPAAGKMAISSPAFARNGEIPKQYTCDGAGTSPPLEWRNVPAKAAALVLFVIDDSSTGPVGGIRWIVGDINPSSRGVAAGQAPAGGTLGANAQGKSGYGAICPPHARTSTVELVLYALSKKIPLSPGFQPAVAEREYGAGKLLMGEAAVTYAAYRRP